MTETISNIVETKCFIKIFTLSTTQRDLVYMLLSLINGVFKIEGKVGTMHEVD